MALTCGRFFSLGTLLIVLKLVDSFSFQNLPTPVSLSHNDMTRSEPCMEGTTRQCLNDASLDHPFLRRMNRHRKNGTFLQMSKGRGKNAQRRKVDEYLESMQAPIEPKVADSAVGTGMVPPEEDDLAEFVLCIARAADKRKAENIRAIRISKISAMTSFVVVVSGNSRPQNQAISASIRQEVRDTFNGERTLVTNNGVPEGNADSGWILLDFGDVMVHIMTPRSRLYYDIEGQWLGKDQDGHEGKGEIMDLSDVIIPNNSVRNVADGAGMSSENKVTQDDGVSGSADDYDLEEEDDPFWS
jgi:ribosome-associated protein